MLSQFRRSGPARAGKKLARRLDDWLARARRATVPGWTPRVLFQVSNTFGYDAQEPVIQALAARRRVRVTVAGGLERKVAPERIAGLAALGVPHRSLETVRHTRFDAIIMTDAPLVRSWRSGPRVYLHHGSSFALGDRHYAFELMEKGMVDYLLALHETEVAHGDQRFGAPMGGRAAVVGQPKLDRLPVLARSAAQTLMSLGLDPARRTVIFLSHWTDTALLNSFGMEVLRYLEARRDLNVIVTGHYLLWATSGGTKQGNWRERLAWIDRVPHMRLMPLADDLLALMAAADLAITDHTSATLEYAILRRPIVFYCNPARAFGGADFVERLQRTSRVFTRMDEFPDAFETALAERGCESGPRDALLDTCFRHLGESGLQAAIAVEQVAWNGVFGTAAAS